MHPLITRDPVTNEELIVTRLEGPSSGITIEGRFSLGWIGRLTPEQLEFVQVLVKNRGNINGVAGDLKIAYNTARNRIDDIVAALGYADASEQQRPNRRAILDRLASKELTVEEAMKLLQSK